MKPSWRNRYLAAKKKAVFINTEPSLTEQSLANETDINVIISRFAVSGTVPGAAGEPIYADFTQLPTDLRGFLETAQRLDQLRSSLPPALRSKPVEELLTLTPEQLKTILTPKPAEDPPKPA